MSYSGARGKIVKGRLEFLPAIETLTSSLLKAQDLTKKMQIFHLLLVVLKPQLNMVYGTSCSGRNKKLGNVQIKSNSWKRTKAEEI